MRYLFPRCSRRWLFCKQSYAGTEQGRNKSRSSGNGNISIVCCQRNLSCTPLFEVVLYLRKERKHHGETSFVPTSTHRDHHSQAGGAGELLQGVAGDGRIWSRGPVC